MAAHDGGTQMTVIICTHDLRANRRDFLELIPGDMPAIYGPRLDTLLRGNVVVQGKLTHKIARIDE
jgi:hypothetical protein